MRWLFVIIMAKQISSSHLRVTQSGMRSYQTFPAGSSATGHPHIISRVFNLKLKTLIDDLLNKHVLGKTVADVLTVEFQKRGLPHAHILLIMDRHEKIRDVEFIDNII